MEQLPDWRFKKNADYGIAIAVFRWGVLLACLFFGLFVATGGNESTHAADNILGASFGGILIFVGLVIASYKFLVSRRHTGGQE